MYATTFLVALGKKDIVDDKLRNRYACTIAVHRIGRFVAFDETIQLFYFVGFIVSFIPCDVTSEERLFHSNIKSSQGPPF
jgi:hypothetical protein